MHASSDHQWGTVKRLLHYLDGPRSLGIQILIDISQTLKGFSNVDWAGNPNDRTSTRVFLIFLVLIQSLGVLQSNVLLLCLPLRLIIVQLPLLLLNCNG